MQLLGTVHSTAQFNSYHYITKHRRNAHDLHRHSCVSSPISVCVSHAEEPGAGTGSTGKKHRGVAEAADVWCSVWLTGEHAGTSSTEMAAKTGAPSTRLVCAWSEGVRQAGLPWARAKAAGLRHVLAMAFVTGTLTTLSSESFIGSHFPIPKQMQACSCLVNRLSSWQAAARNLYQG